MGRTDVRIWSFSCDKVGCEEVVEVSRGDQFTYQGRERTVRSITEAEHAMVHFFHWTRLSKGRRWFCPHHSEALVG